MFTGIIQAVGTVTAMEPHGDDMRIYIDPGKLLLSDVAVGGSIAVNGACLSATEVTETGFAADVSRETLTRTTCGELTAGARVNLEKPLTPSTALGGHLVSGHVDGTGTVRARRHEGRSVGLRITAPQRLMRYIAEKGSICVDGVSLTVNAVEDDGFEVNIVPHTLQATTMGEYAAGRRVNLEVDIIARYLERLLTGETGRE
ncbi:MAG: riboflavin synthase [Gammaproteobacteria bacterium]|nr:riboflavin synthase [Gammaproteobacteria bacterium]NIR82340.1 riboflavin synthase [Gammaproteobacteria bacterium]NIR91839.1 riboflavin synthase [Gammaproteobacteria bacterium]NIU03490.1 riboflavin synthase [Gammaproteobacteria bacterium]NIV76892.1 riboflavin synthase [Gammaproteobacteria bacterium]